MYRHFHHRQWGSATVRVHTMQAQTAEGREEEVLMCMYRPMEAIAETAVTIANDPPLADVLNFGLGSEPALVPSTLSNVVSRS